MTADLSSHHLPAAQGRQDPVPSGHSLRSRLHALWHMLAGAVGLLMGLLPHVLHHIGLLAGTALVAGSGGTALFGALGLLASIPMLVKLHRRFGSWVAPALGLLVFATMFSLFVFVIGPAISGTGAEVNPGPVPTVDLAAAGEIMVGLLILSRGRRVKLGLIGAVVFLLVITSLGVWTLPNPLMAAGLARLLTKKFPHALWDRRDRGTNR